MQPDERAIRELVETWLSATKEGDDETVLSLMSDDVVFLRFDQEPMRGKSAFAATQSQLKQVDVEASSEIQEIKVFGEWAYLWNHLSVVITPKSGGPSSQRAGNVLSILQKQGGSWVLVRDANMLATVS